MNEIQQFAMAHPVCFTVIALPIALVLLYTQYKVVMAIVTDRW